MHDFKGKIEKILFDKKENLKVFRNIFWIGLFIIPLFSFGQIGSNAEELAKAQSLSERLQLSDDQTKTFLAILKEHGKHSVQTLQTHADNLPALRKSLKSIQESQDTEVMPLLSETQYEAYVVEIKKDRAERRRAFLQKSRAKEE